MGVSQLLPFVSKACRQGNIVEVKGCSVALDVSCLLHRGLFGGVAMTVNGSQNTFYIEYVKKRVDELLSMGCHVILVFDGRPLPAKKDTNDERRNRRSENMRAGEMLLAEGKQKEAIGKLQQAVTITKDVVENTIQFFRGQPFVDVIVSPYESDAQLAFLTKDNLADFVITEDSDLIVFGCEKIVFKWIFDSGQCTIYEKKNLPKCFSGEFASNFDFQKFRRICILSGCDYLQAGLPGVGLSKALTFFSKTAQADMRKALPKIPSYLKMSKLKVTPSFVDEFIKAENTFLYQIVFDPRSKCQRPLNPYQLDNGKPKPKLTGEDDDNLDTDEDFIKPIGKSKASDRGDYKYAGVVSTSNQAVRLALGNQESSQPLLDKFLLPSNVPEWSIWSAKFVSGAKLSDKKTVEEKKKSMQCGIFVLDSPSKRRKKAPKLGSIIATKELEEIILSDTPEKNESPKSVKVENVRIPKTLKRKLLDPVDLSYNEMMRIYGGAEVVSTENSSDCKSSTSTASEDDLDGTCLPSIAAEVEVSTSPTASQLVSQLESSPLAAAPLVKKSFTTPLTNNSKNKFRSPLLSVSQTTEALSAKVQSLPTKSSYFVNRSPACANPFKRPCMVGVSPTVQKKEATDSPTPKSSLLSSIDDGDDTPLTTTVTRSPFLPRAGFKPPGLRRSTTK